MPRRWPLHVHVSVLFIVLVALVGGVLAWLSYRTASGIAESGADDLVERIGRETGLDLDRLTDPPTQAVEALTLDPIARAGTHEERMARLPALAQALLATPAASAVYVGYPDGDFFLLRRFAHPDERDTVDAPDDATLLVQNIDRSPAEDGAPYDALDDAPDDAPDDARGRYLFLNDALAPVRSDDRPDYPGAYDPRTRPWFERARSEARTIRTDPYVFFTSGEVGVTLAAPVPANAWTHGRPDDVANAAGTPVVGIDLTLSDLRSGLADRTITPGTHLALLNPDDVVIAHAGPTDPSGAASAPPPTDASPTVVVPDAAAPQGGPRGAAGTPGDASLDRPDLRPEGGWSIPGTVPTVERLGVPVLTAVARDVGQGAVVRSAALEVDGRAWRVAVRPVAAGGFDPWRLLVAIPNEELLSDANSLRDTGFALTSAVLLLAIVVTWFLARSIARPLQVLARDAAAIHRFDFGSEIDLRTNVLEIDQLARTMRDMKTSIRRFLDVSSAVAAETDFDRLQRRLLHDVVHASDAAGGLLLLERDDRLVPSMAIGHDGTSWETQRIPLDPHHPSDAGLLITDAVREGVPLHGGTDQVNLSGLGLDPAHVEGAGAVLAVPLLNRDAVLVGAMLLFRDAPVSEAQASFLQAVAASATTSVETRRLIDEQENLFEALVRMVASAIDAKSPYTGGHCARVPEIAKLLAQAACDASDGPYADFDLSDAQWRELHVASWLHDAGKVTTPDYVVDKATKLETIHDRLHEIRMRFEVIKRDARIDALERRLRGNEPDAVDADLAHDLAGLDDDFAFVAACNDGSETINEDATARLQRIARRSWSRTLSDRIGLSGSELARKAHEPDAALPVREPLLQDRPDHRVARSESDHLPDRDRLGIRMEEPALLYHRGELHNLTVRRGTLTEEERFKVQEHAVQSLAILQRLPFPRHLRRVPEIASAHHERLDGSGYPRRLTGDQMSPLARMLAIADVFEALTAADRPYKTAKTLSESVRILSFMANDGHVDPDLFRLFLSSGAYRTYAERHLRPDQRDEVDLTAYLA